jgi:hypothetical protein
MKFKISVWETRTGWLYAILQMAIVYVIIKYAPHPAGFWAFLVIAEGVLFYAYGTYLNYVIVKTNALSIVNSWLFWRKRVYPREVIKKVEFSWIHRQGIAITVVTTDNDIETYAVGLISKKKGRELCDYLRELNISVAQSISFDE